MKEGKKESKTALSSRPERSEASAVERPAFPATLPSRSESRNHTSKHAASLLSSSPTNAPFRALEPRRSSPDPSEKGSAGPPLITILIPPLARKKAKGGHQAAPKSKS